MTYDPTTTDSPTLDQERSIAPNVDRRPATLDAEHAENDDGSHGGDTAGGGVNMSYARFGTMIATSTIVMFALMYLNTYAWDHVRWSETRAYMALLMGGAMAIIMLGFMLSMYRKPKWNIAIFVLAIATSPARWPSFAARSPCKTARGCGQ